jgi:hypothetical protein
MVSLKRPLSALLLSVLVVLSATAIATAAQSSSANYQVNEAFFGTGGQICRPGISGYSSGYCASMSTGELAVGNTASNLFQARGGFTTGREPSLTFIVNTGSTNLGAMSSGTTKTATGSFTVMSYLTDGYVVVNASDPPTNSSYTMNALTSPTASNSSAEQFGINLVANTSPSISGSSGPVQQPDASFSFGQAATGYDTPDFFKSVKGDTIAYSSKSSGLTDYTISYIFNISPTTPGGTYSFDHVLVATSTF